MLGFDHTTAWSDVIIMPYRELVNLRRRSKHGKPEFFRTLLRRPGDLLFDLAATLSMQTPV